MRAKDYDERQCIAKVLCELEKPVFGHPSNEGDQRIKRLEKLVVLLAQEIEVTRSMIP